MTDLTPPKQVIEFTVPRIRVHASKSKIVETLTRALDDTLFTRNVDICYETTGAVMPDVLAAQYLALRQYELKQTEYTAARERAASQRPKPTAEALDAMPSLEISSIDSRNGTADTMSSATFTVKCRNMPDPEFQALINAVHATLENAHAKEVQAAIGELTVAGVLNPAGQFSAKAAASKRPRRRGA